MQTDLPAGVRVDRHLDMPAIVIEHAASTAIISLFGGQLLSFVPRGHPDLLWVSPTTGRAPRAIRGGVPVCWPWFARQGVADDAPQHGVARTAAWSLVAAQVLAEGSIEVVLAPEAPIHAMHVQQRIRIGHSVSQMLTTTNATADPFRLTQAFHTYFRVGDATRIGIEGIEGLAYLDKPSGFERRVQAGPFRAEGECDRIYLDTAGVFTLVDPVLDRRIRLTATGSRALVVWNAGAEKIRGFTDIPADVWPGYFCLEVANAGTDVVELAPGASWSIGQTISLG